MIQNIVNRQDFKKTIRIKSKSDHFIKSLQNMETYCLSCRKHTDNIGSKTVIMTNKVITEKIKIC